MRSMLRASAAGVAAKSKSPCHRIDNAGRAPAAYSPVIARKHATKREPDWTACRPFAGRLAGVWVDLMNTIGRSAKGCNMAKCAHAE